MAIAKMTLWGMQQYLEKANLDLWVKSSFPEGIDPNTAKEAILLRAGEFPIIYTNPYFMVDAIGSWCRKQQHTFERWLKTFSTDYNPLDNYDGTEEWSESTKTKSTGDSDMVNRVTGYDSDNMRDDASSSGSSSGESEAETVHKLRRHGNLGVTTSAQMLTGDVEVYKEYNLYALIAELFISEFCIAVY